MKNKFIIIDWTGNLMFKGKTFESFEDGWEFIYENVDNSEFDKTQNDNDDNYQEYSVINENEYNY